jgi:hypothetical protein
MKPYMFEHTVSPKILLRSEQKYLARNSENS